MADRFERKMQDIAVRSTKNGGPGIADVLEALVAKAEDDDEQHEESLAALRGNRVMLEQHLREASVRDDRLEAIEEKIAKSEVECPARVKAAIQAEHEKRHSDYVASLVKPRRKGDPNGRDYRKDREESRQVWLMWMIGSKVTYILMAVIITILNIGIHYVLMGEP